MTKEKVKEFFNFKPFTRDNVLRLVCCISVVLFLVFAIVTLIVGLAYPGYKINVAGKYLFSDFAETLSYCIAENPYSGVSGIRSIYPPFAYLIFFPFALICKQPLQNLLDGKILLKNIASEPTFVLSFVLYYLINIGLILLVVAKMSKFKGANLVYLLISVFCFGPFIYTFGRANVILTAFLFALMFFWLYKSEVRWHREIANLCLACSIATKIYPIVLVLFFLKDRRFWDLLKTILYSLILLFLPFLLIQGGFENIKHIWNNFTKFNSGENRNMDFSNISLDSTAYKVTSLISIFLGGVNLTWLYSLLSKVTRFGLLLIAVVLPLFSKKSNKVMQTMILTICTYQLFQGVSYGYTMDFLLVPMILFLQDFDTYSKKDKLFYGICFAIITCQTSYIGNFYFFQSITLIVLVVKAIVDLIKDDIKIAKTAKEEKLALAAAGVQGVSIETGEEETGIIKGAEKTESDTQINNDEINVKTKISESVKQNEINTNKKTKTIKEKSKKD